MEAKDETLAPLLFLAALSNSPDESNSLFFQSLNLAREVEDQWAAGDALFHLGENANFAGEYELAELYWRESLNVFRQTGDSGGMAWALGLLSNLNVDRGRYQEALSLAQECMSMTKEYTYSFAALIGFQSLGIAIYAMGLYQESQRLFQKGANLLADMGLKSWSSTWLFRLGMVSYQMGDYDHAKSQFQESLARAQGFDNFVLGAQSHNALSRLDLVLGDTIKARNHLRAGLKSAILLGRPAFLLAIFVTTAELYAEESDLEYAALLATFVRNQPASQARVKERATLLLTHLEGQLSADDLAKISQRSQESDLDMLAAQLLNDLEPPQ